MGVCLEGGHIPFQGRYDGKQGHTPDGFRLADVRPFLTPVIWRQKMTENQCDWTQGVLRGIGEVRGEGSRGKPPHSPTPTLAWPQDGI